MRLGCCFYTSGIEAQTIQNDNDIKVINIPNYINQIQTFLHADDLSNFITTPESNKSLIKQFNRFSEASGSDINHEKKTKTVILLFG